MSFCRRFVLAIALLSLPLLMSACANLPQSPEEKAEAKLTNDPLEPLNRTTFDVNDFLDRLLIRPLAELYRATVPPGIRDRVSNVVSNMREPVIFANNVLQGRFDSAGTSLERFGINTTLGIAGMWDIATGWDMQQQTGDFGQTLSSWGVNEGPYLVLPLFGPSNFRDAIGLGVDTVMSPWGYLGDIGGTGVENQVNFISFGADGLTRREQNIEPLDALRSGSLDFYAQMRSVYRQYRDKQLGTTRPSSLPEFEDYP